MEPFVSTPASTFNRLNGRISLSPNRWSSIGQISSSLQILFGFLLFLCSSLYLMHTSTSSGQLIGALSILLGIIGVIGLRQKHASLQLLFIVGMGFMAMMTFEFTVQVGRDVEMHCSFAETYNRVAHLEQRMSSVKHDELVLQLFARLNEMDDMMDMVEAGTLGKMNLQRQQETLMEQDIDFVQSKVKELKTHGEKVMDHLISEANKVSKDKKTATNSETIQWQKKQQSVLMDRLEKVETVLNAIEDMEKKQELLTYDEYQKLFQALLGVHNEPHTLQKDSKELPVVKGVMQRLESGTYHDTKEIERVEEETKHREDQRALFEKKFHHTLSKHQTMDPAQFDRDLLAAMEDLPEHCLVEMERYDYFFYGGWVLIFAQMVAAYVASTSLVVSNLRKDY